MGVIEGCFYHVKDSFFDVVPNIGLMANKEDNHSGPHCLAVKDEKEPSIIWMIPVSSKVAKYKAIYNNMLKRYGKCTKILISKCDGKDAAYLIQNAFPTIPFYLDLIHTNGGKPVSMHEGTRKLIAKHLRTNLSLHRRGAKLFFPDIDAIYQIMLNEDKKLGQ